MGKHYVMKICPKCMYGVDVKEVNYCEECGEKLISECPSCKAKIRTETAKYCFKCGHSLRPDLAVDPPLDQR